MPIDKIIDVINNTFAIFRFFNKIYLLAFNDVHLTLRLSCGGLRISFGQPSASAGG